VRWTMSIRTGAQVASPQFGRNISSFYRAGTFRKASLKHLIPAGATVSFQMLVVWIALTLTLSRSRTRTSVPPSDWSGTRSPIRMLTGRRFLSSLAHGIRQGAAVAVLCAALFAALLGAVDESSPAVDPGRSMEFFDWVARLRGRVDGRLPVRRSRHRSFLPPHAEKSPLFPRRYELNRHSFLRLICVPDMLWRFEIAESLEVAT